MSRPTDISPLARVVRRVDAVADGEPAPDACATGFPSVDRWLGGGVRRGDLVVLGGDVGSGKSSLALAMALRMAEAGRNVLFLTGEMSPDRVMERALAIEARIRVDDMRSGAVDEFSRAAMGAAAIRLRDRMPVIGTLTAGGLEDLRTLLVQHPRVDVVVVDALQSLSRRADGLEDELAAVVRDVKAMAVERMISVVLTAHVPRLRTKDTRSDLRPTLDDFGARGAVKQLADVVLAIYREEMYAPGSGVEGATELLVRKNRNGNTGYVDLYFYKQWLRFEDMLDPDR